jgi:uracil phosphoribosyltransferase
VLLLDPVEKIIKYFPVDIKSPKNIYVNELNPDTQVYKVKESPFFSSSPGNLYIIDSKEGREIACQPHIVGESLSQKCRLLAKDFITILRDIEDLSKDIGILHILRAGAGYMVHENIEAPVFRVRTYYKKEGYRDHTDNRSITVIYRDYPEETPETMIIPDTYATGRSSELAIKDLLSQNHHPEKIILYGFIALPALERISETCSREGINLTSYAICNITQLAYNNYDMAAYGLDESYYNATSSTRKIGSIIALETLRKYIEMYIPGLDQPGDWSERQPNLFNGYSLEQGDINGHLAKSINLITRIREMSKGKDWYSPQMDATAVTELKALKLTLRNYL